MQLIKTTIVTIPYSNITYTYRLVKIGGMYKVLDGMQVLATFKGLFATTRANNYFNKQLKNN